MLSGYRELWLLERAKCGLGTDISVSTVENIKMGSVSLFSADAKISFYLCMNSKLDFVPFTECIRNVNEKRGVIV